ncbi:DUF4176 domain-containing protein [Enterococcus faecalis]|uniref:DUF4176 domain-containing protein n=1 Tax=Enterococcus TaxID=1350 RepID=UPI0007109782|nr:DUF4176 domain-containing protein [Enterococcus faecalis]KXF71674.1 hypothetical protein AQ486_03570 [Enterococcus faecalis]KXF73975.1 hypothetical protein AQ487_03920 [Enterococcus faecalis]MBC2812578.1 DUF4176 domain-containing protein [Enterococcus faecalis]MBC2816478.1 DUF4176 domain-containing protein [Enterococcus faecalis]MBC2819503.1 DUF4176 domain-containing protein [Enterococcus faecalis]
MTTETILPIGSIVYLKEGTKKLMVLNRAPIIEEEGKQLLFDYSGAIYPVGLNPEEVFYFNKEDIDEVVFEGFSDEEEDRFVQLYEEWLKKEGKDIKKRNVSSFKSNQNLEDEQIFGF